MLHRHHIVPLHNGGVDDDSNIEVLTVEEHSEAHRLLWEEHHLTEDYVAWKALAGQIGRTDITRLLANSKPHLPIMKTAAKPWSYKKSR
jgi:hypothetical protein